MGYGVFVRDAGAGRTLTKRLIVNGRGDEDEWECDPPRGGRGRRVPALVIVPRGQATRARSGARRGVDRLGEQPRRLLLHFPWVAEDDTRRLAVYLGAGKVR